MIGEKITLGKNASLPNFTKVGSRPPKTDEDWDEDDEEQDEDLRVWRLSDSEWLILFVVVQDVGLIGAIANVIGTPVPGGRPLEVYRWPNEDEEANHGSDDEDENEHETARSRKFNRLGTHQFLIP